MQLYFILLETRENVRSKGQQGGSNEIWIGFFRYAHLSFFAKHFQILLSLRLLLEYDSLQNLHKHLMPDLLHPMYLVFNLSARFTFLQRQM